MSVSDSASVVRLTPRAVRVRNRCLAVLAARRSLPVPSAEELATLDAGVGLGAVWAQWEKRHTPPVGVAEVAAKPAATKPRRRWRSPRVMKGAAIVAAGLLGVAVGGLWRQRVGAHASIVAEQQRWLPVDDSLVRSLNTRILGVAQSNTPGQMQLTAAEMAALIFRSPQRRLAPVDSLEARIDSLLWIRGRLRNGSSFEFGGEVRLLRRSTGEVRVVRLTIDGVATDSTMVSRLVSGRRSSPDVDRLRFQVPRFVSGIVVANGHAGLIGPTNR